MLARMKIAPLSLFANASRALRAGLALSAALVSLPAADLQPGPYELGPDSLSQPGVPQGREEKLDLPTSQIFPGSDHEAWLYIPAQYDAAKPACLMIFQDGGGYVKRDGQWRVPVVFDNLIHKQEMPVTIGLFINPGVLPAAHENALPRFNRSFEYDGLGDRYARFLIEEVIPEVKKKYALSDDPNDRALGGASSGAVCAFTAAWERPDSFRRVFSTIGTYVGLRGANDYPTLIRKTEPKPLRVFLQDGSNDLNIYGGDWWMANQEMERALVFAGYDVSHVWGDGGHDGKQGSAILPDALRWLWRDWPQPLKANPEGKSKQPLGEWCELGGGWEKVSDEAPKPFTSLTANSKGEVVFDGLGGKGLSKISGDGAVSFMAALPVKLSAPPVFTADDRLLLPGHGDGIVFLDEHGGSGALYSGKAASFVLPTQGGGLYFASTGLNYLPPAVAGAPPLPAQFLFDDQPVAALTLSPDHSLLYVAFFGDRFIHSYQARPDGTLAHGQPYFHLHVGDDERFPTPRALSVDQDGRLYAATSLGVQIFDQAGRVNAILPMPAPGILTGMVFSPSPGTPTGMVFGGPEKKHLYISTNNAIYRRPMKVAGLRSVDAPVKPKPPRL